LIDQLAPEILKAIGPIWMRGGRDHFESPWNEGMNIELAQQDFSVPKVLQEVIGILSKAAEAGNLTQCSDFSYRNSDFIMPRKHKEPPHPPFS
jgi:hypothetical protein